MRLVSLKLFLIFHMLGACGTEEKNERTRPQSPAGNPSSQSGNENTALTNSPAGTTNAVGDTPKKCSGELAENAGLVDSKAGTVKALIKWQDGLAVTKELNALLYVLDPATRCPLAKIKIIDFDPIMECCGSPTNKDKLQIRYDQAVSAFTVKNVWFKMGGIWNITVKIENEGKIDEVVFRTEVF